MVGWLGGWGVVRSWFRLGGLVWGWFRVGLRWVSGGFGVWVDLGLGLGLRRGCRVVWFRVGCCERCGVLVHGVKGGVWDRSCRAHMVLDSILPALPASSPRCWYIYIIYICMYIYIYEYVNYIKNI